jgi:hypothetical protein
VEDKGMNITIIGAVLIVAALAAVILLVRCLQRKAEGPGTAQGWTPPL